MYGCYRYGVDTDEKLYDLKSPYNHILRWLMFLGGTAIAIVFMLVVFRLGTNWALKNPQIKQNLVVIAVFIAIVMIVLAVIGVLYLFAGKLNAWLGIFFIFVALYTLYLMFNAFFVLGTTGESTYGIGIQIVLYVADVALIIYTIISIIGEKTEVISKKFKFVTPEATLMWLIFSKAAYTFAVVQPDSSISEFNAFFGFLLFIPLFIIAGFYGIFSYGKMKKERKSKNS